MRLIASSQPSGVVRMAEMRDMFPCASETWHVPHFCSTSWFVTGMSCSASSFVDFASVDVPWAKTTAAKPDKRNIDDNSEVLRHPDRRIEKRGISVNPFEGTEDAALHDDSIDSTSEGGAIQFRKQRSVQRQ